MPKRYSPQYSHVPVIRIRRIHLDHFVFAKGDYFPCSLSECDELFLPGEIISGFATWLTSLDKTYHCDFGKHVLAPLIPLLARSIH